MAHLLRRRGKARTHSPFCDGEAWGSTTPPQKSWPHSVHFSVVCARLQAFLFLSRIILTDAGTRNGRDEISPSSPSQALLKLEKSDLGCGAGGGENNVDVFRMAGLTFLTNANADDPREKGAEMFPFIHNITVHKPSVLNAKG